MIDTSSWSRWPLVIRGLNAFGADGGVNGSNHLRKPKKAPVERSGRAAGLAEGVG
jgi:hypothetical protein